MAVCMQVTPLHHTLCHRNAIFTLVCSLNLHTRSSHRSYRPPSTQDGEGMEGLEKVGLSVKRTARQGEARAREGRLVRGSAEQGGKREYRTGQGRTRQVKGAIGNAGQSGKRVYRTEQ